jgi:predicted kinase
VPADKTAEQERQPDQVSRDGVDAQREARVPQADLQGRAERLPVGHPSSAHSGDGSRKPPSPNLAGLELPLPDESAADAQAKAEQCDTVEPPSDAEYAEHVQEVRDRIEQARAAGLASDVQYTIDPNHEVWSEQREAHHDAIIDKLYHRAVNVPNEHKAIVAGGLPGAGKSTVLGGHAGIDRTRFLTIDPDEIKSELAQRDLIPAIENLSPMEASDLVHEESSYIAKRLARRAQADGKNIVWDITMSSRASTEGRIESLRTSGYTQIDGIFVDIPITTSEARVEARYKLGQGEYHLSNGYGGRFVPPELIRSHADPVWGSVNRKIFEEIKGQFSSWSIYDNSTDGHPPTLIDSSDPEKRPHD